MTSWLHFKYPRISTILLNHKSDTICLKSCKGTRYLIRNPTAAIDMGELKYTQYHMLMADRKYLVHQNHSDVDTNEKDWACGR